VVVGSQRAGNGSHLIFAGQGLESAHPKVRLRALACPKNLTEGDEKRFVDACMRMYAMSPRKTAAAERWLRVERMNRQRRIQ
jgi:hypothetical protein